MVDKRPARKQYTEAITEEKPRVLEIELVDLPKLILKSNGVKYKVTPHPFTAGVYYLTEAN